jgi:hypothetical protein
MLFSTRMYVRILFQIYREKKIADFAWWEKLAAVLNNAYYNSDHGLDEIFSAFF